MSDTTTTITQEERAEWLERLTSKFSCFDAELSGFTLRLLNVLEITEGMLDGSVQETRANFSAVYQVCTEIIPELKAKIAEAEARAEKAEANVARLTNERDWLAENAADRPCAYDSCPFGLQRPTGPDDGCGKTHVQCWQKALTPLVAESEVGE